MTSVGRILDPIRPNNGEARDNMQSGDMAVVRGQEEIGEIENIEDVAVNRAEADEEVKKPKPATDHIPRHERKSMSMNSLTCHTGTGVSIMFGEEA